MSQWETVGKSNDGWEDVGGWETVSPEKRKTTFAEDIGIGLKDAATPIVKAAGLLGGGALGLVGATDAQETAYKTMEDTVKSMEDYWTPKDAEQGFKDKLLGTVATLPAQMLAMPFSAADTGQSMVKAGESLENAQSAALLDTVGNMAGVVLPASMAGGLGKRLVTGAAGNIAQDVATRSAIGGLADTKEMQERFANTPETVGMAGILGAGFGGLLGNKAPTTGETKPPNEYTKAPKEQTDMTFDEANLVKQSIEIYKARELAIDAKLSTMKPDSEYAQQLQGELRQVTNDRMQLEMYFKKSEEPPVEPVTRVEEPPPIVEDPTRGLERSTIDEQPLPKGEVWEDAIEQPKPRTAEEVNQAFNEKVDQYSRLPEEKLDYHIQRKQELLESGAPDEIKALVRQEIEALQAIKTERAAKGQGSNSLLKAHTDAAVKSWDLAPQMKQAIDTGGIRGALEFIANQKDQQSLSGFSRHLGELARVLLNNPLIGHGEFKYDPNFPHLGGYDNVGGGIVVQKPEIGTPDVILHEVVHSAVNRALFMYDEGTLKAPHQIIAARGITDLWKRITNSPEHMAQLQRFVRNKDSLNSMLENSKEFVTYAMTNLNFQLALNKVHLGGTSIYSRLVENFKNLLGLKGKERTALEDVMRYGERLIAESDGTAFGKNTKGVGESFSFAKRHTPEGLLQSVKNGSLNIFAHGFTAQLKQLMRDNPHFTKAENFIAQAERNKESILRQILVGKKGMEVYKDGKIGWATTLKEANDPTAIVPAIAKLSDESLVKVWDGLIEGQRKGIDYDVTLSKHADKWSADEMTLAKAIVESEKTLYEHAVKTQAKLGLSTMQHQMGHITTSRKGDHSVTLSYHGIPLHVEQFMSKGEAKHFQEKFLRDVPNMEVKYVHKDVKEGTQNIAEFLDKTLQEAPADGNLRQHLQQKISDLIEQNSNIGGHTIQSQKLGGFIGDQAYMSDKRKGQLLRDAIPRGYKEYGENVMSREVQKHWLNQQETDVNMPKTTQDLIDFYIRTQIGRVEPEDSRIRAGIKDLSTGIREVIDDAMGRAFGFTHRDKHALDRFAGIFSTAFYINNITMKPAIWLAQPLQTLMASRSAFKEGASTRDVLGAMGETLKMLALGKEGADPQFLKALQYVNEDGNTLHPQLINEYNDIKIGNDPNSKINKTLDFATGKTISAMGDKFSRFASFMFFYNLHKRNGLEGKALADKAARDTTDNMYAYGQKNLPAIYREMGLFGEQAAPLTTFAHGQMGNMIVDIKEFSQKPNAKTAAPLIMTAAVTMLLGGAIAMPVIAEYELLRLAGIGMGWWDDKSWPSVSDLILKDSPTWVSHGVLSDMTDIDLDASMRYTSLFKKISDVQTQGMLAFLPAVGWGVEAVKGVGTLASDVIGKDHTKAEIDTALKATLPKGPVSGAVDAYRNSGDLFTRMGKKGGAGVERGLPEQVALWLGSRSTDEAMVSTAQAFKKQTEARRTEALSRAAQLFTAGHHEAAIKAYSKYEANPVAAGKAILAQAKLEATPAHLKDVVGKGGHMSYEQLRKNRDYQTANLLEKMRRD